MKKLLLLFTVVTVVEMMTSCDPSSAYYFDIINNTKSEIIVVIGGKEPMIIPLNEKRMAYSNSSLGITDPFEYIAIYKLNVTVNDKLMSDDFWRKEYWAENRKDTYHFTYTLTLTDELIERLSIENNTIQ